MCCACFFFLLLKEVACHFAAAALRVYTLTSDCVVSMSLPATFASIPNCASPESRGCSVCASPPRLVVVTCEAIYYL